MSGFDAPDQNPSIKPGSALRNFFSKTNESFISTEEFLSGKPGLISQRTASKIYNGDLKEIISQCTFSNQILALIIKRTVYFGRKNWIKRYCERERIAQDVTSLALKDDGIIKLVEYCLKWHGISHNPNELMVLVNNLKKNESVESAHMRTSALRNYIYYQTNMNGLFESSLNKNIMRVTLAASRLAFNDNDFNLGNAAYINKISSPPGVKKSPSQRHITSEGKLFISNWKEINSKTAIEFLLAEEREMILEMYELSESKTAGLMGSLILNGKTNYHV